MSFSLRSFRPRHLLLSWCAYWLALVLVTVGPALLAGKTTWAGSISILTLVLLVAGPPLVLWFFWLAASARTNNAEKNTTNGRNAQRQLHATDSPAGIVDTSTSKRRTREES